MESEKQPLPIDELSDAFRVAMASPGLAVLTAPTGSGKSTRIPPWMLSCLPADSGQILVLQPRRLAARMLAERVATVFGEDCGQTVGFQTRYERSCSARTRILFVTEGILIRRLASQPRLPGVAAIVFDEFHERSLNSDVALAMARQTRRQFRHDLRLVVMSATMNAGAIQEFLGEDCPHLNSDGRLFPVSITYSSNGGGLRSLAAVPEAIRTVVAREKDGDILVFLPGAGEIYRCATECRRFLNGQEFLVLPLYGELSPEDQHAVMQPDARRRKVILATNIAQTSLTIPGVRHVIDSGLVRQNCYDAERGLNRLDLVPIARDAADQRAGRAGREAPGTCLRLWSALEQSAREAATIPEIRRVDLADAILALVAYGYPNTEEFPWFEPPPAKAHAAALELLKSLGLIGTGDGRLTPLGEAVRAFPVHPRLALLLHLGCQERCVKLATLAAAILSERPLLTRTSADKDLLTQLRLDARHADRQLPTSDFLALGRLLEQARQRHFDPVACERLGLHPGAARDAERASQYLRQFCVSQPDVPEAEENFLKLLLKVFPDRLARRRQDGNLLAELQGRKRAEISPLSLVRQEEYFLAGEIREVAASGVQGVKLQLSLNSGFSEEWLWEFFPDDFAETDEPFFDERRQQVLRRRTLSCRQLLLEETITFDPEPVQAAQILADYILAHDLHLQGWDASVEQWLARVAWLSAQRPQLGLPDCRDKAAVVRALCAEETSYKAVRQKPCLPAVKALLTPAQLAQVERLAPASLPLPNGRKLKIEYFPDHQPRGRARIQDLYDLKTPVTIVDGTVPILLDILAPNMRTVQITDDLERFWQVHYPALKSALARRYPRHEWR